MDIPLAENADKHEFATGLLDVSAGAHTRGSQDWSLVRALKTSFPGMLYLKDILPNAEHCVILKNTLLPIYQIVADGVSKGGSRECWYSSLKTITRTAHGSSPSSCLSATWTSSGGGTSQKMNQTKATRDVAGLAWVNTSGEVHLVYDSVEGHSWTSSLWGIRRAIGRMGIKGEEP